MEDMDLDIQRDKRHWKSKSKTNKTVCVTKNKACLENGRFINVNVNAKKINIKTNRFKD